LGSESGPEATTAEPVAGSEPAKIERTLIVWMSKPVR